MTPLSALVNNWFELRSDAAKMCINSRRPIPQRVDTIGTWLDTLVIITWLGAITQPTLIYLFRDGPVVQRDSSSLLGVCAVVLFSEHAYFVCNLAIQQVLSKLPVEGQVKALREAYTVRNQYLKKMNITGSSEKILNQRQVQSEGKVGSFWILHGKSADEATEYGIELLRR